MTGEKSKDPLHGITLEHILIELHAQYGWENLAGKINIRCFKEDPSLMSSLKFLRKTPWARTKVERLYVKLMSRRSVNSTKNIER
jgi:uncharacterized protein (DUF2132 family)